MSDKDKNTQAEYDFLSASIKGHDFSGNYSHVLRFTNSITASNKTHFSYVPVVFEFVRSLLKKKAVTGLISRTNASSQVVVGIYYPITHDVIAGVIVSLPTLTHHADEVNLIMVNHEGRLIGAVLPHPCDKLLIVDSVDMIATILSSAQLDHYSKLFTLLSPMKTFTKMYVYPLDATSINDDILDSQLTDLE
jgi:hypothetical protein